ncbi:MAG: MurR/RpiR family transcriptional regulator [Candidatus Anaerobiospirillum merdipullorum]|uniref:MurR/RpiR family transcriptional regulator n=1 Tax=Candidatus Anaerobiospirillum merdipullorum TaxID=2838450 RepID=A0A9E2NT60_9GAMM|nr:MurR/RpiR family transcriptional regulator [Candidatus Anaerobiospirillum merdipullorum]
MALNLLDKISARVSELTKSERKIAAAVLDDPALTVTENIAQLAKRAQVSEPTVYRFCKTFGTDGFPAFKIALSAELNTERYAPRERVKAGDSVADIISKVIGSNVATLNELNRTLDATVLARCIDLVSQARRIVIAACGMSQPVGQLFYVRMLRLGLSCEFIVDSTLLSLASAALRPGELLIAFSSTGQNRQIINAMLQAKQSGAAVIACCPRGSDAAQCEALHLFCPPTGNDGDELWCARFALMNMVQIVLSGVMLRRADSVRDLLPRLNAAQQKSYLSPTLPDSADAKAKKLPVNESPAELKADEPITTLTWPY